MATQTEWETMEVGTQAGCDMADAGSQVVWATTDAGTQAVWATAETDTRADWADVAFLRMRMASQMGHLDAEHGRVVLSRALEVQNTHQTMGFEQSEWFSRGPIWVEVKLTCVERLDDSLKNQWWYLTNTFYAETAKGNREQCGTVEIITYIQRYCGGIVHVSSHFKAEARLYLEMDGVLMVETTKIFQGLIISADGRVSKVERTSSVTVPAPTFSFPQPGSPPYDAYGPVAVYGTGDACGSGDSYGSGDAYGPGAVYGPGDAYGSGDACGHGDVYGPDAFCGSDAVSGPDIVRGPGGAADSCADSLSSVQGSGDSSLLPETTQTPSLCNLFLSTGLGDFSLRLSGLRLAFAVLLAQEQYANFLTVAGQMIVRIMAALSGKNTGAVEQAFDQLVAFSQSPECGQTIETELQDVGIHSVNLLDIIFEMVFFGELEGARARLVPRVQGGFLDHVAAVIHVLLPSEAWPPQAWQCRELLRAGVQGFLVEAFSQEHSVYAHPQELADRLFSSLEQHVDQLLSRMPD